MAEQLVGLNTNGNHAYSTTSWIPTGKYWIDGKMIYERVITTTHSGTNSLVDAGITNIDTLICHNSNYSYGTLKISGIQNNSDGTFQANAMIYIDNGNLKVHYRGTLNLSANTIITSIIQATLL